MNTNIIEPVEKEMIDPVEKMMVHLTGKRSSELSRKDKAIKFPVKLMYALECGCYDDIMSWSPSGLAFVIMDPKRFQIEVLPELFKEAKFSSFDRKIRRWGFVKAKVNRGTKSCCYGHPKFQKGNYSLCMAIPCSANQQSHVFGSYHDSTALQGEHGPNRHIGMTRRKDDQTPLMRLDEPIDNTRLTNGLHYSYFPHGISTQDCPSNSPSPSSSFLPTMQRDFSNVSSVTESSSYQLSNMNVRLASERRLHNAINQDHQLKSVSPFQLSHYSPTNLVGSSNIYSDIDLYRQREFRTSKNEGMILRNAFLALHGKNAFE